MYRLYLFLSLAGQDLHLCAKNTANLDASGQGCWSEEGVGHSQRASGRLCDPGANQGGRGTRDQGAFFTFSALLEMEGDMPRWCAPCLIPTIMSVQNRSGYQSRALYPPIAGPPQEIAEIKLPDLNCRSVESAIRTVLGTARNMGIAVKEAAS